MAKPVLFRHRYFIRLMQGTLRRQNTPKLVSEKLDFICFKMSWFESFKRLALRTDELRQQYSQRLNFGSYEGILRNEFISDEKLWA